MSRNDITNDEIKSKINTKEYEDNYDRIFKRKPESLDAAYERRAMMQGLVVNPLFDENKELVEDDVEDWNGLGQTPQERADNLEAYGMWTEAEEKRLDVIGQNGPSGLHYEEIKNED